MLIYIYNIQNTARIYHIIYELYFEKQVLYTICLDN